MRGPDPPASALSGSGEVRRSLREGDPVSGDYHISGAAARNPTIYSSLETPMPTPVAHSLAGVTMGLLSSTWPSGRPPAFPGIRSRCVTSRRRFRNRISRRQEPSSLLHSQHRCDVPLYGSGLSDITRGRARAAGIRRSRPGGVLPVAHLPRPVLEGHRGTLRNAALLAALQRVLYFAGPAVRRHLAGLAREALRASQLALGRSGTRLSWGHRRCSRSCGGGGGAR